MFRRKPKPQPNPQPQARPQPRPADFIRFLDEEPAPAPKAGPTKPDAAASKPARRREFPIGTLAFVGVLGTGLVLRGLGVGRAGHERIEQIERTFAVSASPRVVVETFNGPIEVTRGEPGRVDCRVEKRAGGPDDAAAEAALKNVAVAMVQDGETVRVTARRIAGGPTDRAGASVTVEVPEGTSIRLETDNGPIRVKKVEGPVEARSTNGPVDVRDAAGVLSLATTNGRIACEATEALVAADSTNGSIEFRGSLAPGQSVLRTANGKVTLRLPEDQAFRVDARAQNGKVTSDFEPLRKSRSKTLVSAVGHHPEASVKVRTENGSIRIVEDGN